MPVKKLGFVVSQLSINQLCYDILRSSNEYLAKTDDVDICLFWYGDGPRVVQPNFSCMNAFECYGYDGNVVCTNLHTISRVLSYPGPNRQKWIYFYDYNLDYTKIPAQNKQWEQLASLYNHKKVQLIARSESYADILSSTFRKPLAIIESCNIEKFKELI